MGDRRGSQRNSFQSWLTSSHPYTALNPPPPNNDDFDYDYDGHDKDVVVNGIVPAEASISEAMPTLRPTPGSTPPTMSMAVLTLIIVASLSAVVGAIYLLIYFKSIKPMSARSRSYADPSGGKGDDEGARKSAGHPFFRRK